MSDPVTNALLLQMEMGSEELKAAIEERIREIVREELLTRMIEPGNHRFELQGIAQQEARALLMTSEFRRYVNDALIRLHQHLQHNTP